tara:strand:+ start:1674 stop:1835 length:162 start_codon:yes stop_codon:yes gene_type:complete
MSNSWHGGKGSSPRKINDRKQFEDNWDKIFGSGKKTTEEYPKPEEPKIEEDIV